MVKCRNPKCNNYGLVEDMSPLIKEKPKLELAAETLIGLCQVLYPDSSKDHMVWRMGYGVRAQAITTRIDHIEICEAPQSNAFRNVTMFGIRGEADTFMPENSLELWYLPSLGAIRWIFMASVNIPIDRWQPSDGRSYEANDTSTA